MSASMREVRVRESHDCDKIHPQMNHLEWVAQNKDAANQDKDPVGAQHEEVLVEDMSLAPKGKGRKAAKALYQGDEKDEPRTQVGTKHKIKPQYNTKTHKLITTPSGNVKVVPKSTPGMEAEETEWAKSKRQDREAQKRSEKQHDEREARYQRQQSAAKKEEVENEVYKPNYGRRPFEPKNPKPHPAGITGPHNYPVNGDEKKKERDALVKAVAKSPKQQALKKKQDAAKKEEVEESNLPPHLAKFFDKKGNLKPDAAKRMAAGKVKRKSKDVTPKGYGPNEEVEVDETVGLGGWKGSGIEKMPPVDKKTGKYVTGKSKIIRITKKGEKALKKGDQKLSITAKGRAAVEEVEVDEVLRGTPGFYKKKGTPNLDASRAASKAKREKDNPKKFRTPQQAHLDKKPGWDRFPEEVEVDEQEMMQLKHKKSGQVMRMARKVYQKQAHIQRERGWVPDSKQPHMRGGSALQHSYEPEGDTELQEMDFKVKIKGLPIFYVPGRSVGEIRAHMRKNLKRPQDVEWVERTTVAQKKKDFRLRAQDKDSG
tara:strand:+ start:81 stop:1703 length:1623 start_codon:yes stop_codon:yes gene_type:complete